MRSGPVKITFAELRGIPVYCADYRCGHSIALMADRWPDATRLSNIEPRFVCTACGKRSAGVRPDFNWSITGPIGGMGYR
jgi:hypothetical protein